MHPAPEETRPLVQGTRWRRLVWARYAPSCGRARTRCPGAPDGWRQAPSWWPGWSPRRCPARRPRPPPPGGGRRRRRRLAPPRPPRPRRPPHPGAPRARRPRRGRAPAVGPPGRPRAVGPPASPPAVGRRPRTLPCRPFRKPRLGELDLVLCYPGVAPHKVERDGALHPDQRNEHADRGRRVDRL